MSRNVKGKGEYDVIVIGGGPSGMMAAIRSAERGLRVLLIEKNRELGEKLSITGGGRCNITNAEYDIQTLLSQYGEAKKYLFSTFSQFGVKETFAFFESRGLKLRTEERNRVFPKSQKATDVTLFLTNLLASEKVDVVTNAPVLELLHKGNSITGVRTKAQIYEAKSFVIATGGVSHPETGSTGDGFTWLTELGHTVHASSPDIVPLTVRDEWVKERSGTVIKNVRITFTQGNERVKRTGDILCTHFGFSGPTILNAAREVRNLLKKSEVKATIDLFPLKDTGELRQEIIAYFDTCKNKTLKNALKSFVPHNLSDVVLVQAGDESFAEIKVHSITKEARNRIVDVMKGIQCTIVGTKGFRWAVISDGGVAMEEVDTKTMQSKKYKNLFLTGDILNVSRPSGGYSLQLCWTTGYIAGNNT